jgi:hypothetical protein
MTSHGDDRVSRTSAYFGESGASDEMSFNSFQDHTLANLTYWQARVSGLQCIVCELMQKNERLRSALAKQTIPTSPSACGCDT